MKLSFSIQYWNDYSWANMVEAAVDARLNGIELYNVRGPVFHGKVSPTNPEMAASTRRNLAGQSLSLPCISTSTDFTSPEFAAELQESIN